MVRDLGRRPVLLVAIAALAALCAYGAWAISSPIGASPDDDYHLASAWCAPTAVFGLCAKSGEAVEIPAILVLAPTCYQFRAEVSGGCVMGMSREATITVPRVRANLTGHYPGLFYSASGFLASSHIFASTYAMRLLNVLLVVAGFLLLACIAPPRIRQAFLLSLVSVMAPLGYFIIASNNPSGWAVGGVAMYWAAALTMVTSTDGWRRGAAAGLTVAASVLAVGSRADAAVYIVVSTIAVAAMITVDREWPGSRRKALPVTVIAACSFVALLVQARAGQSVAASGGLNHGGAVGFGAVINNFGDVPGLVLGSLGAVGLGWLDTPVPSIVWVAGYLMFGGFIFIGLRSATRGVVLAAAVVVFALFAIPMWVAYSNQINVWNQLQPRYLYPLLFPLIGLSLFGGGTRLVFSIYQKWLIIALVVVAYAASLHANIRRWVVGADDAAANLNRTIEWWSNGYVSPMATWAVGVCSVVIVMVILAHWALPTRRSPRAPVGVECDRYTGPHTESR